MVGLSLRAEKPAGIPRIGQADKHCHFIRQAREGNSFYIRGEDINCPLARFYLGVENSDLKALARILVGWDDSHDEDTAVRYLKSAPHLENCPEYIAYFPYPHESLRPDVIIKIGSPGDIMGLIQRFSRFTGVRVEASLLGIGAACGECTAYPLATGKENVSLGCYGSRPGIGLEEGELLLAFPPGSRMVDICAPK
jgi:uncharacterized protein (DUF169 family)